MLAQSVAQERAAGKKITVAEALLRKCSESNEPALIKMVFEYAFRKVPDKIETNPLENKTRLILHYAHELSGSSSRREQFL